VVVVGRVVVVVMSVVVGDRENSIHPTSSILVIQ
jgi:hypothetical protein